MYDMHDVFSLHSSSFIEHVINNLQFSSLKHLCIYILSLLTFWYEGNKKTLDFWTHHSLDTEV